MKKYSKPYLLSTLLLSVACAHVEAPPGGQHDREPPELVAVQPDSLAVVAAQRGPVVFTFDERLSERGIDDRIVWVSPRTSGVRVGHRGSTLRVDLRDGWEPGRIYHVTVLPGIADLFGNRRADPITVAFSTGPEIPETRLVARVVDRITGRPAVGARVEAITADSLVYALPADSAGVADFRRIPLGEYVVRAFNDVNRNRALDVYEPRDVGSATVAGADSVGLRLSIVEPDTTPPALATVRAAGENVEARFDDYLDPEQPLAGRIQLVGPDGTHVQVERVGIGQLPPSDTARAEPADTAQPQRLPSRTLVIRPATALEPETEYELRVQQIRNVVGLAADAEGSFRTPEAPARPAAQPQEPQPDEPPPDEPAPDEEPVPDEEPDDPPPGVARAALDPRRAARVP